MKPRITFAHIILFLAGVAAGVICGGIAAAFIVPLCTTARGYYAIGSEWCIIVFIAYAGYTAFNNIFFKQLERR